MHVIYYFLFLVFLTPYCTMLHEQINQNQKVDAMPKAMIVTTLLNEYAKGRQTPG